MVSDEPLWIKEKNMDSTLTTWVSLFVQAENQIEENKIGHRHIAKS